MTRAKRKPPREVWFFCTPNGEPVGYSFYGPDTWQGATNGAPVRYVLAPAPAPVKKRGRKR